MKKKKENRLKKSSEITSRPVEMRDKENHSILLKSFSSIREAAIKEFGDASKVSSISKCVRGEKKADMVIGGVMLILMMIQFSNI